MKEYFELQYKMLNRKMHESGVWPIIAYVLASIVFFAISILLFSKTEYAAYLYALTALSFISKLSEKERNYFLKSIFSKNRYRNLRIVENLMMAVPFLIFLLFKQSFIVAIMLFFTSILISGSNFNFGLNFTIPTPFSRRPFEFPVGFRRTFFIFPFAYFLIYQSILVGNINLGIASIILIAIVVISYYSKPESEFYIWTFSSSAKQFLIHKIKTGLLYFTLLSIPALIFLIGHFSNDATIILMFLLLGYVYITTIILAKYSAYPNEMNLPETLLIAISVILPPLLLGAIPLFYVKSIRQLKPLLEND